MPCGACARALADMRLRKYAAPSHNTPIVIQAMLDAWSENAPGAVGSEEGTIPVELFIAACINMRGTRLPFVFK